MCDIRLFRCGNHLEPLPGPGDQTAEPSIEFLRCQLCQRDYTRIDRHELVDRWLSPTSLALCGVIFESQPSHAAEQAARSFFDRPQQLLSQMVNDIREELAPSVISSKPATRDRLKTGHLGRSSS